MSMSLCKILLKTKNYRNFNLTFRYIDDVSVLSRNEPDIVLDKGPFAKLSCDDYVRTCKLFFLLFAVLGDAQFVLSQMCICR
jgi:hypothetical protein